MSSGIWRNARGWSARADLLLGLGERPLTDRGAEAILVLVPRHCRDDAEPQRLQLVRPVRHHHRARADGGNRGTSPRVRAWREERGLPDLGQPEVMIIHKYF